MPVPAAYNDMSADAELRDHIGWVWYQTSVTVQYRDMGQKFVLRFGSVNYYAIVYFNGEKVGCHEGGHLPFEVDVTDKVSFGEENNITVAVNNTLSNKTIPPGEFRYVNPEPVTIQERNVRDLVPF
ncbi:glycosyl hydrolase family 2, sugar binding domain protein [Oesophagostomum dentatum]|uniref:Glycosyl hydrolase family 2, sugar binding domain protein n=1 Tax=Oesophagostomum dentatum TaxID=61180 RepID=A0A0B1SJ87_OESDE|nr:glycosyl hydrolase family 2, sugar binding domain protein [Oesophagostomum dentatum]